MSEQGSIRIAPAPNFPPVESFDEQGQYVGIAADYAAILESKLGLQIEVLQMETWGDVVESTKKREVDVWMEAAATPEREEFMNFSAPYIRLPAVIIVRRDVSGTLKPEGNTGSN